MTADERLEQALLERDEALQQLAATRAELDALKLRLLRPGEPEPPLYPATTTAAAPPPLRYVAVDAVHAVLKRVWSRGR